MKAIRTLIVDDEPLARSRIHNLLKQDSDIILVGESRNGQEALAHIREKEPDLVFLDIQMPDLDGFGVIQHLKSTYRPFVIFVTAYDQYALKAFDVHAIDYLLKPYDNDRFSEALSLAKAQIRMKAADLFNQKLLKLMKDYQSQASDYITSFNIKKQGREIKVYAENILWIEANGNYVNLHLDARHYLYRSTMNTLASELNPQDFLRIHRSLIVHIRHIEKVNYLNNNEYKFRLRNGKELISGRSYKSAIMTYLSEEN